MRTPLVDAGADFLAVCQAVWGKDDPAAAVRAFEAGARRIVFLKMRRAGDWLRTPFEWA